MILWGVQQKATNCAQQNQASIPSSIAASYASMNVYYTCGLRGEIAAEFTGLSVLYVFI